MLRLVLLLGLASFVIVGATSTLTTEQAPYEGNGYINDILSGPPLVAERVCPEATGRVLEVPSHYHTIQEALAAAQDGDKILVRPSRR